jgi:hypothetical protein
LEGLVSYNLSPNAYNQVKDILNELLDLNIGDIWKQSFENNVKAARLIRQGFEYCKVNKEEVGERLASLKSKIRIKVTNEFVIAERKFTALTPVNKLEGVRKMSFFDFITLNEVVTTFLKNQQLTAMGFPNAKLTETELRQLNKVAEMSDYIAGFDPANELWIIKNAERGKKEEHTD